MALHPHFPESPHAPLHPDHRWFPGDDAIRESGGAENLLPPLVDSIRREVHAWREVGYEGASVTTKALLTHWFQTEHLLEQADGSLAPFQYYFAQQEAVETAIWLYEVRQARDKFDLMRFDSTGAVSTGMFDEEWPRYVLKLATGAGKTKVLSLMLAWAFFHKTYETESPLARNFLLIAPNIIVLDRLRDDFDGLRIFFHDPILPPSGYEGRDWKEDFQLTLHIQDDVRVLRPTGNIFLTNIHRVYWNEENEPSLDDENTLDYFLDPFGPKPSGKTTDNKTDLGELIRDIDELMILNDEAHHIHDKKLAWFKSIQDIHHRLLQKDTALSLQLDVTATPKHNNGSIFVQTVSDYPLVEAIHQNVVKHPVLPDAASRARLEEKKSALFHEKYEDYLQLGVEEWRTAYQEHEKLGKKAVLFVMVDDTKNCDDVGLHLEKICPELEGSVLVIHTNTKGEISEAQSKAKKEELETLRKASNEIDSWKSPYKAIVSVLMLKEGWDVKNVTTIVGLRAYSAKSNILPEQTLGRGLRRMYFGTDTQEKVSVMGTPAFMEFVESIQREGVEFEYKPMGAGASPGNKIIVEVDEQNEDKDLEQLDIAIPRLARRYNREFKNLDQLDPAAFGNKKLPLKSFDVEETREIIFKRMLDDEHDHITVLDGSGPADYRSVVAYFARALLKDLRLVGGYEHLYPAVRDFMRHHLFDASVDLEDVNTLRNLSEPEVTKIIFDTFKSAINTLTIHESGTSRIESTIKLRDTRPFRSTKDHFYIPKKSIFNRIVGDQTFEERFANWLDDAPDVAAFAKNYLACGFSLDYVKPDGELSHYIPDFFVRADDGTLYIIETKGAEERELEVKMERLAQWCADASAADPVRNYDFIYVDQKSFEKTEGTRPKSLQALVTSYTKFK